MQYWDLVGLLRSIFFLLSLSLSPACEMDILLTDLRESRSKE